jgi:hypothetical protein
MTALLIADTFAGTPGDRVVDRPPTTNALNAAWASASPNSFVLASGPAAVNNSALNTAQVNLTDYPGGDFSAMTLKMRLDTSGATPVSDSFGGILLFLVGGTNIGLNILNESGVYKASGSLNGTFYSVAQSSGSVWDLEVGFTPTLITAKVNGVLVSSKAGAFDLLIGGSNQACGVTLRSAGSVWKNFQLSGTYDGAPPAPSAFWTALRSSREEI